MDTTNLLTIPIEIRAKIFNMCKRKDCHNMSLTSKHWFHEMKPILWTHVQFEWKEIVTNTILDRNLHLEHTANLRFHGASPKKQNALQQNAELLRTLTSLIDRCNTLKLRTLSFCNFIVNGALPLSSERFTNVQRLTLFNVTALDTSWSYICDFRQLKHLYIFGCNVEDFHFSNIGTLKHLLDLEIIHCVKITGNCLDFLPKVPFLNHLSLGSLPLFVDHKKPMQRFPKLKELVLDNVSLHDDIFFGASENLPELVLLDLSLSRVTEYVLQDISTMPSLQSLFMAECGMIQDQCLFLLSTMESITVLDLWGCTKVTDIGIDYISRMKSLQWLDIGFCSLVTDVGISYLRQLSALRSVRAKHCDKLSQECVKLINLKYSCNSKIHGPSRNRWRRRKRRMQPKKKKPVDMTSFRIIDDEVNPPSPRQMSLSLGHFLQFVPKVERV